MKRSRTISTGEIALLREAKLRATPQRRALISLLRAQKRPVSVEDLVRAGRGKFDTTTAYRTLEVLEQKGLVRKLSLDKTRALFEVSKDHHHHAVCVLCGQIRDIALCIPPALDESVRKAARFVRIESHSLEFFGICAPCDGKRARLRS